jgi:hypothetical protein
LKEATMKTIKERYDDGQPTPELVRVDSMRKGTEFTPAYGGHWIAENRSHCDRGQAYFITEKETGRSSLMCASALVMPGWHARGWLQ